MNRGFRNDNRQSRFSSSAAVPQIGIPSLLNSRTPEQIAFEAEFSKWEAGFEEWKRSWANHPDRSAYVQYEQKFLEVREKLIHKRAQIYGTSMAENYLKNQLTAASLMAESILSKFGAPNQPVMNDRFGGRSQPLMNERFDERVRSRSPRNRDRFSPLSRDRYGQMSYGDLGSRDYRGVRDYRERDRPGDRRENTRRQDRSRKNNRNRGNDQKGSQSSNFKKSMSPKALQTELSRTDVYPSGTPW